jgi:hypothetical protein
MRAQACKSSADKLKFKITLRGFIYVPSHTFTKGIRAIPKSRTQTLNRDIALELISGMTKELDLGVQDEIIATSIS